MSKPSDPERSDRPLRDKIIGLGDRSVRKSYYPQLQRQLAEAEESKARLQERSAALLNMLEDLEEARRGLEESEVRYRSLVENIGDVIFTMSPDGILSYVSPVVRSVLGYDPGQLAGTPASQLIPPEDLQVLQAFLSVSPGQSAQSEIRVRRDDGTTAYGQVSVRPVVADGEVVGLTGVFSDITERKRAEEERRLSEEKFVAAFRTTPDLLSITRLSDGRILEVNPGYERLLGYSRDESVGKTTGELSIWVDSADRTEFVTRLAEDGEVTDFETMLRRKDGSTVAVLDSAKRFELGGEDCVLSVVHDITDRKRAEGVMQARLRLADYAADHTLQQLLQATLDEAEILSGSSIGFYHFLDDDQRTLTLQAWSTNTLEHMCTAEGAGQHYALDQAGVWVDCVRERRPVIHNDYESLPNRKGLPDGHAPVERELVVPVFRAEKVVAILGVGNKPGDYDEADVRTVESLAEVAWEVAERKRAQEALVASEEEHRTLLQKIATAVIVHDVDARIVTVNAAALTFLGADEDALLGKTPHETGWRFFREDATPMPAEEFPVDRVLATGEPLDGIVLGLGNPSGETGPQAWILANAEPVFGARGEVAQVITTFVDVTQRRQMEVALQESEGKYREIFDSVSDALTVFDVTRDGRLRYVGVNASAERILGVSASEVLGKYYEEVADSDEAQRWLVAFREALERMSSVEFERRHVLEGEERYLDTVLLPVADESGVARRLIVLNRDVTERRRMEQDLSARERESRTLLESIPDFIVRYDRDLRRTYVNPAWEAAAGLSAEEVLGEPLERTLNVGAWYAERIRRVFETGERDDVEFAWKNARDETLELEYALVPERDDSGQVVSVLAVGHDITEAKQAEELRIAKQAAEKASVAKSAFLASMSHEIRTPMNAILGFSQLMQHDAGLSDRQRQQLEIINKSGEHLLALINDVLEMSKIEAGRVVLSPSAFDLHELIDEMRSLFGLRAQSKGLSLRVERTEDVPHYVFADENKLRQVMVNLLGNALKFTDFGGVELRVGTRRDDEERLRLTVEVEDTGRGIPRRDAERVFEYFERAARQGAEPGTGLGLAISREFVRVMGGEITVDSVVGEGSVFRFEILIEPAAEHAVSAKTSKRRVVGLRDGEPKYRVLVVDDIPESRELLRQILEPVGFSVREAANGMDALEAFESWTPHLILMDMRMPIMDGYEATRKIRAAPGGSEVAIVAVTASAFAEMRQGVFDAGVDEFLVKPFAEVELFEKIEKVLGARFTYETLEAERGHAPQMEDTLVLRGLPDELIIRLRRLVAAADFDAVLQLADEAEYQNPQAASVLRTLAERFDADGIFNALPEEESAHRVDSLEGAGTQW